jgi:hypothetical protein
LGGDANSHSSKWSTRTHHCMRTGTKTHFEGEADADEAEEAEEAEEVEEERAAEEEDAAL